MSNKSVILECVYSGAQYFKLKISKNQHLRFTAGKATLTQEQWKSVQDQLKERGTLNLIGYEFGPVGSIRNPAVIEPIRTVRGLDKASTEASSPRSKSDLSVDDHIRQLDEERLGDTVEATTSSVSDDHINPDEAQRLIAEQAETERILHEQARVDAENRQKAKEESRAKAKAKKEAARAV